MGRKIILGGETIPYQKGLDGYSDADVLIHSLIDALLGAAGEGDIGQHFPDNDEQYKNISSLKLLENTYEILKRKKFTVNNIDVSVVLEEPRITPFTMNMKNNIVLLVIESLLVGLSMCTEGNDSFYRKKKAALTPAMMHPCLSMVNEEAHPPISDYSSSFHSPLEVTIGDISRKYINSRYWV